MCFHLMSTRIACHLCIETTSHLLVNWREMYAGCAQGLFKDLNRAESRQHFLFCSLSSCFTL